MKIKIFIIVTILLFIIVVASLIILRRPASLNTEPPEISPSQTFSVSPTEKALLTIKSIYPRADQLLNLTVIAPITIQFSEEISLDSLSFVTEPNIEIDTTYSNKTLVFSPKEGWPLGQEVTITITSLKSKDGINLSSYNKIKLKAPVPSGDF